MKKRAVTALRAATDGGQPVARARHAACANSTHMFVFGGKAQDRVLDDLHRLNTCTSRCHCRCAGARH